jgi:hypothetical protein
VQWQWAHGHVLIAAALAAARKKPHDVHSPDNSNKLNAFTAFQPACCKKFVCEKQYSTLQLEQLVDGHKSCRHKACTSPSRWCVVYGAEGSRHQLVLLSEHFMLVASCCHIILHHDVPAGLSAPPDRLCWW